MAYELIRAGIQRIFQDKILMGLVIVGILAIIVGGFGGGSSEKAPSAPGQEQEAAQPASGAPGQTANPGQAQDTKVDPVLAKDFIKWWIGNAMDYNAASAQQSHTQAMSWMTPEAAQSFQSIFWTPEIAENIKTGRMTASFKTTNVQALALNPDGSVVVGVSGSWMVQQGQKPAVHEFIADFLVKKDMEGLRVSGLYNRSQAQQSSSVY